MSTKGAHGFIGFHLALINYNSEATRNSQDLTEPLSYYGSDTDEKLPTRLEISILCLDFQKARKKILKRVQNCQFALSL